jgi:hypothetical protein
LASFWRIPIDEEEARDAFGTVPERSPATGTSPSEVCDDVVAFADQQFRRALVRETHSAREIAALAKLARAALKACELRDELDRGDPVEDAQARAARLDEQRAKYLKVVGGIA